jgi:hypothetical protein
MGLLGILVALGLGSGWRIGAGAYFCSLRRLRSSPPDWPGSRCSPTGRRLLWRAPHGS